MIRTDRDFPPGFPYSSAECSLTSMWHCSYPVEDSSLTCRTQPSDLPSPAVTSSRVKDLVSTPLVTAIPNWGLAQGRGLTPPPLAVPFWFDFTSKPCGSGLTNWVLAGAPPALRTRLAAGGRESPPAGAAGAPSRRFL